MRPGRALTAVLPSAPRGPRLGHIQELGNCVHLRGFHLTAPYVSIKLDTDALVQGHPCTAYSDLAEKPQEVLTSSAEPDLMASPQT